VAASNYTAISTTLTGTTQRVHNLEANTGLQLPLSTLRERRRRLPRNTRFRLAGCASTGRESNPLDRFERFQVTSILLSRTSPVARFVYAKPPFAGPEAVLAYLARYTHRVAIANSRLMTLDERGVTFGYKDYRRNGQARYRTMTLSADEFIRRFLLHVLPKRFHRIRHYGLLASPGSKANIARARELIAASMPTVDPLTAHDSTDPDAATDHRPLCPCCAGRMLIVEVFGRGGAHVARPPAPRAGFEAMTIPAISLQRSFAGTSRSWRGVRFIPPSLSAASTSPISPRSGPRLRWQGPVHNHQRLSALTTLCKTIPRQRRGATNSP
jgi:hypothetical protein